jgi:IPT/TIG domain
MRRLLSICLLVLSAAALVATAPAASAAKRKAVPEPEITRVTPMRISVGRVLTIRGHNFKPRRSKNTVVFRAPNGRSAFAKPRTASRTKLTVVVPASVARLLVGRKSIRFKLRVLAGRFSKFTPRRLSPVVVGADDPSGGGSSSGGSSSGGGANAACSDSSDHDGDLLSNAFELQIRTDPCLPDTDLDGVEDGYEYQSALDLNHYPTTPPLPYPGKRPYPNALDSSDGVTDYDGDGLQLREEQLLWLRYSSDAVGRAGHPTALGGLLYSDGLQQSVVPAPALPGDALAAWALDQDGDGVLSDDERDADGDGIGNWDEQRGRFIESWWVANHDGDPLPKESKYPELNFLDNEDLPARDALADPDMDGDGVLDGEDDHDHDGLSNRFELRRPADWIADALAPIDADGDGTPDGFAVGGSNPWAYVQPFNPCKPFDSARCHDHPPFGHYDNDGVPPIGPTPPAGYPGSRPATPDG